MNRRVVLTLLAVSLSVGVAGAEPPLVLRPIAKLGAGAKKEVSGIVRSRRDPTVFWTINDSGDEPRIYPVRADGAVVKAERYPDVPGILIAGAANSDWEDIALDRSGRVIAADFGNNSNARADLTLYFIEEPEPTEGRTTFTSKAVFRYPDQPKRPAPEEDFNFDAEAMFTIGDDVYVLSKNRSDSFTKLYRLDERADDRVNVLTYLDRFDVKGRATGADASDDGLTLALLTYDRVWVFERSSVDQSFFTGRVRCREYAYEDGRSDSEAICFQDSETLLIADEARARLYSLPLREIPAVRPATVPGVTSADPLIRVMSFNIRLGSANDGENAWAKRRELVEEEIRRAKPDVLGMQEVEAHQADWLRERLPEYVFHGVGRMDGDRKGEFAPLMLRAERFEILDSGHFWLSESPDVPGVKGWDAACERMASWVKVRDRLDGVAIFILNTHLDHVGVRARAESLKLINQRTVQLSGGAPVVVMGDFNCAADRFTPMLSGMRDTFRVAFPQPDTDEATFNGWKPVIGGDRIDWIVASPQLRTLDATIERRMPAGRFPSDHWPVTATFQLAPVQK